MLREGCSWAFKSFTFKPSALVIRCWGLPWGELRREMLSHGCLPLIPLKHISLLLIISKCLKSSSLADQRECKSDQDHGPLLFSSDYGAWKPEHSPSEESALWDWVQGHSDAHLWWRRRGQCLCPWKNLWVKLPPGVARWLVRWKSLSSVIRPSSCRVGVEMAWKRQSLTCVLLFATAWTLAH